MNTVLCLGGYGQFGAPTARMLLSEPLVERVIVAGRDLNSAQALAATLGDGCEARQVDADDPASLAEGMKGVDLVVSTLWSAEGRAERVAQAAVEAGAHYFDLNSDRQDAQLDAAARDRGVALLTSVGSSPGVVNLLSERLLGAFDEAQVFVGVRHWTRLLDAWEDLFDAYIDLPGGRKRGPRGRQLFDALTEAPRDPDRIAAVVRDACVVPFWLEVAGDPERWTRVPVLMDGAFRDVDVIQDGLDVALTSGEMRSEHVLTATGPAPSDGGLRKMSATITGFHRRFDEAVRDAARRIAAGADAEAEGRRLEQEVLSDIETFLRPPHEIARIPVGQFLAFGTVAGTPARGWLAMNDALFTPERFVPDTVAALVVTARYLLDGTITARGSSTMVEAIGDVDGFAEAYMQLIPGMPHGAQLYTMRVDSA